MAGQQQEEIETIRSRTIEVKLSDADVKRISEKAAAHGLTVGELIENFIGDLVCGTYSNGSDERMYAEQWFERCWLSLRTSPQGNFSVQRHSLYLPLPSEKKILCASTSVLDLITFDFWINEKAAAPHHERQEDSLSI